MMVSKKKMFVLFIAALAVLQINAAPDPNFHIYLLFGQSNMAGGYSWRSGINKADCDTNPRIKVLAFQDCPGTNYNTCNADSLHKLKNQRVHDQWYTAFPPLHDCGEGLSPGDYFAKTMIDSISDNIKIGLVPCALSGMALNVFLKNSGAKSTVGPPNGQNAYPWMLARCKLAQQTGVIKGILLHQGESGSGSSQAWDAMAMQIFNDLKNDLSLDVNTPIVVGELRSDNTSPSQNNSSFNTMVDGLPGKYSKCAVASSQGLTGNGLDVWHFTSTSFREFGKRYAKALLSLAGNDFIPRKGTDKIANLRLTKYADFKSQMTGVSVYSLNGKVVHSFSANDAENALRVMKTGGVYIVNYRFKNGQSTTLPFVKE